MREETHSIPSPGFSPLSGALIRYVLAPLFLCFSGFHTTDFLVGGLYTWPEASRFLVLNLAILIFSYEFVYKDFILRYKKGFSVHPLRGVVYTCLFPYMAGSVTLLILAVRFS